MAPDLTVQTFPEDPVALVEVGSGASESRAHDGAGPEDSVAGGTERFRRDSLLVVTSSIVAGIGNYGFSLALIWVLPTRQFAVVAAVSTLLLVAATAASSALPWVLAREVSRSGTRPTARRQAAGFSLVAAVGGGAVAAAMVMALASPYASPGVEVATAVTVIAVFISQVGVGHLQGAARFLPLAVLAVVEVAVKTGLGVVLAAGGWGPTGAMAGAAVGASVWALAGLLYVGKEVAWPRREVRAALWRQVASIGGVQLGIVAFTTLDVVIGSIRLRGTDVMAFYQAMLVFARAPLFVSGAVSHVAYPRLVSAAASGDASPVGGANPTLSGAARDALTAYLTVAVAAVAVVITIPSQLIGLVLPSGYSAHTGLLLPLGIAGMAAGQINVVSTCFQSEGRVRPMVVTLWTGVATTALVIVVAGGSATSLAWTAAACSASVALIVTGLAARRYGSGMTVRTAAAIVVVGALAYALSDIRSELGLWLIVAVLVGLVGLYAGYRERRHGSAALLDVPTKVVGALLGSVAFRRRVLTLVTRTVDRLRPLAPPAAWQVILAARSAAGQGPVVTVPRARRVLVLAPHPDDETIGCGGTVALLAQGGAEITVVVASSGEMSVASPGSPAEMSRLRRSRAAGACEVLGARPPVFLGLPDCGLGKNLTVLQDRLAGVVAELRPEAVFVPWLLDGHPDHGAMARALADTPMPQGCEVWGYEVWASLPANRIVDVTRTWEAKVAALDCHRGEGDSFDLDGHLALARWRSIFGMDGKGHAEAFLALDARQFSELVRSSSP